MSKNIIQRLYNKVISNQMTKNQFILEVAKYPQYKSCFTPRLTYEMLLNNLRRKGVMFEMQDYGMIQQSKPQTLDKINFSQPDEKEIHIISVDIPNSIDYIYNDKHRQIGADDINEFLENTYNKLDNVDNDETSVATDFLIHNQDKLDQYPQVDNDYSVDDLNEQKGCAIKVVKARPISINEELTYDQVSSHAYNVGFSIEFDKCKDALKAGKKVLANLEKDPSYYTNLIANYKQKDSNLAKKVTSDTLVDKDNGMKIIKKLYEIENLIGGLGDGTSDKEFDKDELEKGTKHEMEHTNSEETAKEIAKDHLSEDPEYYKHLSQAGIDEDFKQRLKEVTLQYLAETGKPSSGLSKEEKSEIVKKAKHGYDFGKKGKGFDKIVSKAEKSGYPEETAKKIAGAIFWKGRK
jgi:hypothetical protein